MVASNIFIDKATGQEYFIEKALLEIVGMHRNLVLLVSNKSESNAYDWLQMTDIRHQVVFDGKLVSGNWSLEANRHQDGPDHLLIKFHFTGDDSRAKWHRYEVLPGTSTWIRTTDGRVFAEIHNLRETQAAFGCEPAGRPTGRIGSTRTRPARA